MWMGGIVMDEIYQCPKCGIITDVKIVQTKNYLILNCPWCKQKTKYKVV